MKHRGRLVFALALAPLGCASSDTPDAAPRGTLARVPSGEIVSVSSDGAALAVTLRPKRLTSLARRAEVRLSASADGATRVVDVGSGMAIRVGLARAERTTGVLEEGRVVHRDALGRGAHLVQRAHAEGFEDYVVLPAARAEVRWTLELESGVAGLRTVGGLLELLDASGTPRLRMEAPYAIDAAGARVSALATVHGCSADTSPAAPWGRAVVAPGARVCEVSVAIPPGLRYPAVLDPSWQTTGMMTAERANFDAASLADGRALLVGGLDAMDVPMTSAELFDPATKTFAATGSTAVAHSVHGMVTLDDGRVLVVGGYAKPDSTTAAELYDATAGTFSAAASMKGTRGFATVTKMTDGRVLVVGGCTFTQGIASCDALRNDAEVYDPASDAWSNGGTSKAPRLGHAAAALPDGSVLVVGGLQGAYTLAEIWKGGAFTPAPKLPVEKINATATLTTGGVVVIAGGENGFTDISPDTIEYDVAAGTFKLGPKLPHPRQGHRALNLAAGVTLIGGYTIDSTAMTTPAVLIPDSLVVKGGLGWVSGPPMGQTRASFAVALVANGFALAAGGNDDSGYPTATAETYGDACVDDSMCGVGYCTPAGFCASKKDPGATCAGKAQCVSGNCVDGVCCDTPCLGGCQACDGVKPGTCSAVKGAPHGSRPACPGAGTTCGGACDGVAIECAFPGASTACGTCSNGHAHVCDGKGTCPEQAAKDCKEYVCGAADCTTSCSDDTGCSSGYTCAMGKCLPKTTVAVCMDDHLVLPDGSSKSCAPFKCTKEGACLQTCDSSLSCTTGNTCNASRVCAPTAAPAPSSGGGGCGCSVPRSSSPAGLALGLAALVGALARRRRAALRTLRTGSRRTAAPRSRRPRGARSRRQTGTLPAPARGARRSVPSSRRSDDGTGGASPPRARESRGDAAGGSGGTS